MLDIMNIVAGLFNNKEMASEYCRKEVADMFMAIAFVLSDDTFVRQIYPLATQYDVTRKLAIKLVERFCIQS